MNRIFLSVIAMSLLVNPTWAQNRGRPNILWITCEDIGPHLGCYGDSFATTPNLDRLARKGVMYTRAWSNAPVCAPARTTIITGMYPTSTGSEHMRSMTKLPAGIEMFPVLLRRAGYYCTNHIKEDYNLEKTGKVWDASSKNAHWKNREAGQPFFSVFNILVTHESQIRKRPHQLKHDPAKVRIPAYHPDTPEVRQDWAQYYDNITTMDEEVGRLLQELEEAGLLDNTIIVFFGDHGSGMPRNKRSPYNSGLQVPFIVSIPEQQSHQRPAGYTPGGRIDRLVSFIDLAPTMLSLAGQKSPDSMQGSAFLGEHQNSEPEHLFGFRGRMDERYDLIRSVRDRRYVYVRNYLPHKIGGQHVDYMFETPTTRVWKKLFDEGKLNAAQKAFWEPRSPEELYDLDRDPDEVVNLASSPHHQQILSKLRRAEQDWVMKVRDVGFLPEGEIHERSKGSTPYEMGHDDKKYALKKIFQTAELASSLKPDALSELKNALTDDDSAVRYWAALGILMRGKVGYEASRGELEKAQADRSPYVRILAAEIFGQYGTADDLRKVLPALIDLANLERHDVYVSLAALNAIDSLGLKAVEARASIQSLPVKSSQVNARMKELNARLTDHILSQFP